MSNNNQQIELPPFTGRYIENENVISLGHNKEYGKVSLLQTKYQNDNGEVHNVWVGVSSLADIVRRMLKTGQLMVVEKQFRTKEGTIAKFWQAEIHPNAMHKYVMNSDGDKKKEYQEVLKLLLSKSDPVIEVVEKPLTAKEKKEVEKLAKQEAKLTT